MSLAPGTRLGPYEIGLLIGAGGMGEVYRAMDTLLARSVAIKILPDAFASDGERLARFEREARMLAALNHPNIAGVYGFETGAGVKALVMELVDGATLADRLARGPISIDEALPIARQIAEALEAAHEQGIIHRDLKPANVKVRDDGTVKVLDFGLAKALGPPEAAHGDRSSQLRPDLTVSPTITTPLMTQTGVILGTAAYMSPEQAKGRPADKRSDVWAFGAVLYEMLSGTRAFDGEDTVDVLGAVARLEPNWQRLPASTPPLVRSLIQSCLVKNRKERLGDIAGALLILRTSPIVAESTAGSAKTQPSVWKRLLPLAAAAAIGLLLASVIAVSVWPRVRPRVMSRFTLDVVAARMGGGPSRGAVTISADGRRFAVITREGLYVREKDALEPRLVYEPRGVLNWATLSPDGESLAFYEAGQLKRLAAAGGTPVTIAAVASNLFGASWSEDNTILFGQPQGIMRVPADGGEPELIVASKPGELVYGPQMLPDRRTVLYSVTSTGQWNAGQVVAQRIGESERTVVVNRGSDAKYLATGHLAYALADQLFVVPFDATNLTTNGRAESALRGTTQDPVTGSASYVVADDGTLIYVTAAARQELVTTMVWVDRQGRETPIVAPERAYTYPRVSPDGSRIAVSVAGQLYVYSVRRGALERVSINATRSVGAEWSRSGTDLIFYADGGVEAGAGLFRMPATRPVERVATGSYVPMSWTPDDRQLVILDFAANLPGTPPPDADLGLVTLDERAPTVRPLMRTRVQEDAADLSPDGRWIAIETNEPGQPEVFVRPFPDAARQHWQISVAGGWDPVWSRDGKALFYRTGNAIMEVAVTGENPAEWGRPVKLFEGDYFFSGGPRYFDVARDGRFLMIKPVEDQSRSRPNVVVVLNWDEEVKRLAPLR